MENQNHERNILLNMLAGIGIGALVGAIAGLLLAPKSGTETRQAIGTSLNDLGGRLTDLGDQVASRVRSAVEAGRHAMGERGGDRSGAEEGGDRTS